MRTTAPSNQPSLRQNAESRKTRTRSPTWNSSGIRFPVASLEGRVASRSSYRRGRDPDGDRILAGHLLRRRVQACDPVPIFLYVGPHPVHRGRVRIDASLADE